MKRHALFFNILTMTIFTLPAFAADDGITGVQWGRKAYNFEAMPSGPQPIQNNDRAYVNLYGFHGGASH